MGAALRELKEELDFDLLDAVNSGLVLDINHIGRATTPDFNPYRFEAHYLLIDLKEKPEFKCDENEIAKGFWASFEAMEKCYRRGELIVIPPMWLIRDYLDYEREDFGDFNFSYPPDEVPSLESIHGVVQLMPLSNTLPPASRTNAFLIGEVLVDPSPKDEKELEKLINTLGGYYLKKVFITHHHGDHHQQATKIAERYDIPLVMSEFTRDIILKKGGVEYFGDCDVEIVSEGEKITEWLGHDVNVYEVPGHDEGQLALAPKNMAWFIAGDLFQGIGTVVIGGDEGDMQKYFKTLNKVIALAPKAVYPSHGIALGGTNILQKTLKHRKLREEQVKEMHEQGLKPQQMLKKIYFDIPKELHKYALANIQSHLDKIKKES